MPIKCQFLIKVQYWNLLSEFSSLDNDFWRPHGVVGSGTIQIKMKLEMKKLVVLVMCGLAFEALAAELDRGAMRSAPIALNATSLVGVSLTTNAIAQLPSCDATGIGGQWGLTTLRLISNLKRGNEYA